MEFRKALFLEAGSAVTLAPAAVWGVENAWCPENPNDAARGA
jgi:hypothetical protein